MQFTIYTSRFNEVHKQNVTKFHKANHSIIHRTKVADHLQSQDLLVIFGLTTPEYRVCIPKNVRHAAQGQYDILA